MSSPNLNMLTLLGSVLTYTSGFLFAIEDRLPVQRAGMKSVMQVHTYTHLYGKHAFICSRHFILDVMVVDPEPGCKMGIPQIRWQSVTTPYVHIYTLLLT